VAPEEAMPTWPALSELVTPATLTLAGKVSITLLVGLLAGRLLGALARRVVQRSAKPTFAPMARRATFYVVFGMAVAAALDQLGFDLTVLLGAAGVLTVALGFASQTSASNLISGLFLMLEGSVAVGDVLKVGDTTGEVVSVDLLSVKLRTFDNLLVRVPNESLVKAEITNLTRFPIRRIALKVGVAYREDLDRVRRVLQSVAEAHPAVLREPAPKLLILGFLDSAIDLQFNAWTRREAFWDVQTDLYQAVREAFAAEGIEIPFPQRTLSAAVASEPLPVRMVSG